MSPFILDANRHPDRVVIYHLVKPRFRLDLEATGEACVLPVDEAPAHLLAELRSEALKRFEHGEIDLAGW